MKEIKPWFYDQFQCTAQHCSDTCCAGWAVMVDDESTQRYRQDTSPFGLHRQSKLVDTPDGAAFEMNEDGRCPFLTKDNLCQMIQAQGAASLCEICANHPRFFVDYGQYEEAGIGLCCEEGCRLLLSEPLHFGLHTQGDNPEDTLADTLFQLRSTLQEIALDTTLPLSACISELRSLAHLAQCQLYGQTDEGHPMTWEKLLEIMADMEPIDECWQVYLTRMTHALPTILQTMPAYMQSPAFPRQTYGNVLAYLLYRHFPYGYWDGAVLGRTQWAVSSLSFLHLCFCDYWHTYGDLPMGAQIELVKNWSKQVEYSDENTQLLLDVFLDETIAPPNW